MFHHFQKAWVIYLVTSYTVFTLPAPVVSQSGPIFVHKSDPNSASASPVQASGSDVEPIAEATNIIDVDDVIAEATAFHRGGGDPPRKHSHATPPPRRPPRRHPHPPPHHKKNSRYTSPKKPVVIKTSKKIPVPKPHHRDHEDIDNRHRGRNNIDYKHHGSYHRDRHVHKEKFRDQDDKHDDKFRDPDSQEHRHKDEPGISEESKRGNDKREKSNKDGNKSFIEDEFFRPGAMTGGSGPSNDNSYSEERDHRGSREVSSTSIRGRNSREHKTPLPFPKPPKTVQLSYFYDSKDDRDLKDLVQNHHLRRRKDCDGLDNFVYDLEIIAFFLGLIAAGIGFYADVIPFFNEGVKITYNNDHLEGEGDGTDFPHDYWPIKGATHAIVHPHSQKRTIKIGTIDDNQREVLSVTGEFIGVAGLALSFVALFPSLVEKFFYSLDWWFGKRGLWKQYLYTYKCEIHAYPKPGWG